MSRQIKRLVGDLARKAQRLELPTVEPGMDLTRVSIIQAMEHPKLFGREFGGASWDAWRVFLKALFGLRMTEDQHHVYARYTGREEPVEVPSKEGWVVVGRRGGKSRVAALVAVYLACFRRYRLARGERGVVMLIAADRKQARVTFGYVTALIDSVPALHKLVAARTKETVEFTTNTAIEIATASMVTTRGYTLLGVICDEIAFWRSEDSAQPDREILNALRPGMASIPNSLLVAISTPYSRRGELFRAHDRHWGQDGPVLVWKGMSQEMNATLDPDVIARAYESDPVAAASEYGASSREA